jgi:hypothetical protein
MRMDLEGGEISGQNIEGKIKKRSTRTSKFGVVQQNQFFHDAQRDLEEDRACKELQCAT